MRVVSSRELSSSLTRASASCSSDTSSSTSSSPVAFEFKIKGCHFKCFKLSILETVCVWVCVMILSEGIIAWSCLQKQLLQGRNTHLACSANCLKSSHCENCQCSPLLIVINLGSKLSEMQLNMSCLWYCLFYGQIMIIGHSCSRKFNVFIFLFFSAFVFWLWSVFNVTMIFLRTIIVSIMRICWSLRPISSFWETDPKSLFNRLLTHHLGRLLTQVQLQKLLKAHL